MKHMLPEPLLNSLADVPGFDRTAFEEVHASGEQVVSIRFNPAKLKESHLPLFPELKPVPWCSGGYYLASRPSFTLDPLLHGGVYYVQEAASMFIAHALKETLSGAGPVKLLDLCAAPGGKSTLSISSLPKGSLVVSNEVIKTRVPALLENLTKWGEANVVVTSNDAADFTRLPGFFDLMMVDAPCSGSGLFRRDPSAIAEWSPHAVDHCSLRQQRILSDAFATLKEGGILLYSTCSYSAAENEDICDWLCANMLVISVPLTVPAEWNITTTHSPLAGAPGYRFFPDKTAGEGFFVACFRKNGDGDGDEAKVSRKSFARPSAVRYQSLASWTTKNSGLVAWNFEDEVFLFPDSLSSSLFQLQANVYLKKAGVTAGRFIRDEFIPAHDLAVSSAISSDITAVELTYDASLEYLRRNPVHIAGGHKGWVVARYKGVNLGFLKMLGNRINNYYPKEWRILKSGTK